MKNEKGTRFFAFSPKASKSRFVQAGLLTYPLFYTFPLPEYSGNSGLLQKSFTGITAAGTVQELPTTGLTCFPFNSQRETYSATKLYKRMEE